jgi:hypothetical protein
VTSNSEKAKTPNLLKNNKSECPPERPLGGGCEKATDNGFKVL